MVRTTIVRPTIQMKRFVIEYQKDHHKTNAAIRAGYSEKGASVAAAKLMKHPWVRAEIAKAEHRTLDLLRANKDEALLQLVYLATRTAHDFVDPKTGELLPIHEMDEKAAACINGFEQEIFEDAETGNRRIKNKIRLSAKETGVDMFLKHLGMMAPQKVEVEHSISAPNWDALLDEPRIDSQTKFIENKTVDDSTDEPLPTEFPNERYSIDEFPDAPDDP